MTEAPVFVVLNETGAALARRLADGQPGAEVHGLAGRVESADLPFASMEEHLGRLFQDGRTIVAVAAAGIVIRLLAPLLSDKTEEPPVICIAEDGSTVVPLLGGHRGANRLADDLAQALGCPAAITTAGEARFGLALDDPPPGWRCSGREAAKPVMAALLSGEPIRIEDETSPLVDTTWLTDSLPDFMEGEDDAPLIRITERHLPDDGGTFALHPATLILGVGCERDAEAEELIALARETLAAEQLSERSLACIATLDLKEDEGAILDLADALGVPVRLFGAARLEAETRRLENPSDEVFAAVGCHGVAEAAALAAAGADAILQVPKRKGPRTTSALARAPVIVDPDTAGHGIGRLSVVGIGPGSAEWRAPEASSAIAEATDLVGYSLYLDLLEELTRGKTRHDYRLGEERDRVAEALRLAASGRRVALICSGDAGIYAMASLVYELVDESGEAALKRLHIHVVPGISALQAAAARAGAPLGHDFCTVSLSDLLTPWEVIEKRLRAAAEGDFVVALYNPVSRRRRDQLMKAKAILLARRPAETPVVVARNLGRDEERVTIIPLGELESDQVDMLTLLIIGNTETRTIQRDAGPAVYTPRGYGAKAEKPR